MLSVLVATFNSSLWIEQTLSSIFSNGFPRDQYEVIVVDDGSTDNTIDIVKRFPVKLFASRHHGHGTARNLGIKRAKGNIICFTDSDIIVPPDWLKKISTYFANNSEVSAIGGPLLPSEQGYFNKIQKLTAEIYFDVQHFPTAPVRVRSFEWATLLASANSAYRKKALASIGGFPEFEEIKTNDMYVMWSLLRKEKCIMFLPDLRVVHLGFPWTVKGIFKQQFSWGKHRSMTTNAYNSTYNTGIENNLGEWVLPPYQLAKSLVKIPFSFSSKQCLDFFQRAVYFSGRLYGRCCKFRLYRQNLARMCADCTII